VRFEFGISYERIEAMRCLSCSVSGYILVQWWAINFARRHFAKFNGGPYLLIQRK